MWKSNFQDIFLSELTLSERNLFLISSLNLFQTDPVTGDM